MTNDVHEWNERYRRPGHWAGTEPAEFLVQVLPLLLVPSEARGRPLRGTALDVASGEGRNALYLAAQGWHVFAVEMSRIALGKTESAARERGIPVNWSSQLVPKAHEAGVTLVEADLESFALPAGQFDFVLCIKYLQRSLFPSLERALHRRGVLVFETYTEEHLKFQGSGPRNPEFLLRPGELRETFRSMEILFYSEICAGKGMASLLGRKL